MATVLMQRIASVILIISTELFQDLISLSSTHIFETSITIVAEDRPGKMHHSIRSQHTVRHRVLETVQVK